MRRYRTILDPKTGRLPIFTRELADKVLVEISKGVSMHKIEKMEGMP